MPRRVSVEIAPAEGGGARNVLRGLGGRRNVGAAVKRAVLATLAAEEIADAELSVTLLGDAAIAELNQRYLSHVGPTDVLSFPLWSEGESVVGDVYIGTEQALRQAGELEVPPLEELMRMAVHGTLHVLGYDHPEGQGRVKSAMWRRQEQIVASLGEFNSNTNSNANSK